MAKKVSFNKSVFKLRDCLRNTKILLFLSVTFFLSVAVDLSAQKTQSIINEGLIKERDGKIDEAIEDYKKYIKEHPGDRTITIRLMNLLFRKRRYKDVISIYHNLDDKLKRKREIVVMLGRSYFLLGQEKDTERVFGGIILDEGGSESSYSFVGSLFLSIGLVEDAKKTYLEGRKKWGENRFSRELYICYKKEDDYKKAITEIFCYYSNKKGAREWVKREIKNLVKKDESIISEIEKAARGNKDYQKLAGEIFLELGKMGIAKKYLLRTRNTATLLNFASVCIKEGYYDEAEESLNKVIDSNAKEKEKEAALYLLSLTYARMSRFDDAIKTLDYIIKQGKVLKDSAIVEKTRIMIYNKKEFKKGVRTIEPLLDKKGFLNHDGLLTIAVTGYIKSGNLKKAEDLLQKSTSALSFYLGGEILFLKALYEESKDAFLMAVSKGLDKDFANNALERIMIMETLKEKPALLSLVSEIENLVWTEKYNNAVGLINSAFGSFKDKEERTVLLFYKGRVYSFMGRINDAISSYISIIGEDKDSPLSPKALYKAALLCKEEIKNFSMAKELLRKVIFEYPESVEAELSRGELEVTEEKFQEP